MFYAWPEVIVQASAQQQDIPAGSLTLDTSLPFDT